MPLSHCYMRLTRRVDGYAVHAVMVGRQIIRCEIGTDNDHRVDGESVHPTDVRGRDYAATPRPTSIFFSIESTISSTPMRDFQPQSVVARLSSRLFGQESAICWRLSGL